MSQPYREVDPLENAVLTISLRQAQNNIWVVNMKANCKGWIPTQEQYPVKISPEFEEI